MIYKPEYGKYKPRMIPLRGIFMGEFYNNEKWKVFEAGVGQIPTEEDVLEANAILLPGSACSTLCDTENLVKVRALLKLAHEKGKAKIVGMCFGHQLVAQAMGGQCRKIGEFVRGVHKITGIKVEELPFGKNLPRPLEEYRDIEILEFHGDEVCKHGQGFKSLAICPAGHGKCEILISDTGRVFTVECHPEYGQSINMVNAYNPNLTKEEILQNHGKKAPKDDCKMREVIKTFMEIPA